MLVLVLELRGPPAAPVTGGARFISSGGDTGARYIALGTLPNNRPLAETLLWYSGTPGAVHVLLAPPEAASRMGTDCGSKPQTDFSGEVSLRTTEL